MADQHWQLERENFTITVPSDLVLCVVEHRQISRLQGATTVVRAEPTKIHLFRVDLDTLAAASVHFSALLESRPAEVQIDESDAGNVTGLLMWLKIIHYVVTPETHHLHLYEVWHVCSVAVKYGFNRYHEKAYEWFDDWYNHQPQIKHFNFRDYEQLVYPTKFFNHAAGFAQATKYLAYRSNGPISEAKPEEFHPDPVVNISTDPAIMVQINSARSRLTTVLHRALYAPISKLLSENKCHCGAYILFGYEKALADTGCWPIHPALEKTSMKAALEALSEFGLVPIQVCRKPMCNIDLQSLVENTIKDIEGQFSGLCLDCMDDSILEGVEKAAYWRHHSFGVPWDDGCRILHTQPSWFFSFMGDRAEMNQHLLQSKTRQVTNNHHEERGSYGYGNNAFQRGDTSHRGPRQEIRNSNRPGRRGLWSRAYFPEGLPGHAIQEVTGHLTRTNISEIPDAQNLPDQDLVDGN